MGKKKTGKAKQNKHRTINNDTKTVQNNHLQDTNGFNEENEVEPEDLEFYQNTARNLQFLTNLTTDPNLGNTGAGKKRKRKKAVDGENEEAYEKQPRLTQEDEDDQHILLPIKSRKGFIQRLGSKPAPQVDSEVKDKGIEESDVKNNDPISMECTTLSVVELYARRQQKLNERKVRIAELSSDIIENPEQNIAQLKELCSYCEEKDVDIRITTRKLAMVSLLEVFKDIVPGYTLRLPTEKEKETKVSKEVGTLQNYEQSLLVAYQKYLQTLEKMAQGSSKKKKPNGNLGKCSEGLSLLSIQCMCDLLLSLSHFNYRNNLITVLVPRMCDSSLDRQISQLCCETFSKLFKQDKVGEVSLEATKVISKYVKSQNYRVKPRVLQVFLSLRINDSDVLSLRKNKNENMKGKHKREKMMKAKMSKKERKRKKEMKSLEKELQATQAVEGQQKIARLQTEILKLVFATYFRVLKNRANSPLLSPVLEGLAKHAHLINVDFFVDLMAALKALISKEELPITDKLNCSLTAFKILSGQGEALNIDPRGFYCTLYTALLKLDSGIKNADILTALKCLDVMMAKRSKQIPIQRVSSFAKRLSTASLHSMPNAALALLAFVRMFFQFHPRCQNLLDSDTMGTGVFRPEVDDPELCNTDNTTSWELSYLTSRHYHPSVRELAGSVVLGSSSKAGSSLTRTKPEELFKAFDSSDMKLKPEMSEIMRTPSKHQSKKPKLMFKDNTWTDSSIELAVQNANDFVGQYEHEFQFKLPSLGTQ